MSDQNTQRIDADEQDNQTITVSKLADAQDGSEILFAAARLLEHKHGQDYGYAHLVRQTAHAVRDMTDGMQHWVVANENDPLLSHMWQDIRPRDTTMGAGQHRNQLAHRLGITS